MRTINMKSRIMFGIYLMYLTRKLRSPLIPESFVSVLLSVILSVFVSVPSVISNTFESGDIYRYLVAALSHTTILVQMILVLCFATITKAALTFRHLSSVGRAPLS